MSQAAVQSDKSHRTLPGRLQRSRGRRTRGDRWELSVASAPRPAKAPRVVALSSTLANHAAAPLVLSLTDPSNDC
jgi:hypothetical protein